MKFLREAFSAEVLQNGLRVCAIEAVKKCAKEDFDGAIRASERYEGLIENELESARRAILFCEALIKNQSAGRPVAANRGQIAERVGVTKNTLRNWERNGLVSFPRQGNGACLCTEKELQKLLIIRTLRTANFSISAILRLMTKLQADSHAPLEKTLNAQDGGDDVITACDRLIISLAFAKKSAKRMQALAFSMKAKFVARS